MLLSSLWIMICSLLSKKDINKAMPKRACSKEDRSIQWWKKHREEGRVWTAGATGGEAAWGLRMLQEEVGEGVCFLDGKERKPEFVQTKFEVCILAAIKFYSLVPADVESQDKCLRHYIRNCISSPTTDSSSVIQSPYAFI